MAKVKTAGLSKAEGITPPAPLIRGQYEVRVENCEVKPSERSACDVVRVRYVVLGGPEQEDGREPAGRNLYETIALLKEEHPSYEDYSHIGVNQLKDLLKAAGAEISKQDGWDPDQVVGAEIAVRVKVKPRDDGETDDNGNPLMENVVSKHLSLED